MERLCRTCGINPVFRSKARICMSCILKQFKKQGMELIGEFQNKTTPVRCRCVKCGIEADYIPKTVWGRGVYPGDRGACDACYLKGNGKNPFWPGGKVQGDFKQNQQACEEHGLKLVEILHDGNRSYAMIVECRRCGRRIITDSADLGFGCSCMSKAGSASVKPRKSVKLLVSDSDSVLRGWWDFDRNSENDWKTAARRSATKQYWWRCSECGCRFQAPPLHMPFCPECSRKERERFDARFKEEQMWEKTTHISEVPDLLDAWDDEYDPRDITLDDWRNGTGAYHFKCPKGHRMTISPATYLRRGCPTCRAAGAKTKGLGKRALSFVSPEISYQWESKRNGEWTPANVAADSKRQVWWKCAQCGHEWKQRVRDRFLHPMWLCPRCKTLVGSLAYFAPDLAAEWSPENPLTAWEVTPTGKTPFLPLWECSTNPEHHWRAKVASRWSGHSSCPECKDGSKSIIELEYYAEARQAFDNVRSGVTLRSEAFTRGAIWRPDIICRINGFNVVIEYDGAYWHMGKADTDERKSRDLLDAGWIVVRLRENGLPSLGNLGAWYEEISIDAERTKPVDVIKKIMDWVAHLNS